MTMLENLLTAIDRTASNCNDAKEKVQKIRELVKNGRYNKV